jgi:molybdate transport system substrate-binding protein
MFAGHLFWLFALSVGGSLPNTAEAQSQPVRVAAAADLQWAMSDLVQRYESQSHTNLQVTYGSSGNFFSQIQQGAPFDLFFSADTGYPRRLQADGLAEPGSLHVYAVGRIVLWAPPEGENINPARQQWRALSENRVKKIAIANPEHAPYGRAAIAALQKAGIYEQVGAKLIYGENIGQAAQFVQSGNAQLGIIAKSLALSPSMKNGQFWDIPEDLYPPIEQAVVLLKASRLKEPARTFLAFVGSGSGRSILASHGFSLPNMQAAGQ